ncbi:MAG: radical SAM protein [Tissierellia bacterium]|nr:radical SAM protein [Tissierellia bacterium]
MSKRYIIPIFVPHLGCPNDCIFCNQKKITNRKQAVDKAEIVNVIETQLGYFPKSDNIKEIAFFGGSFTAIDRDLMIEYLDIARDYKRRKIVNCIRISTRPDAIDEEILDILKEYGVDIIELGVQSMDDEVLRMNNRGHDSNSVVRASKLIKNYGITLGHQIMPGLYMDSFEKTVKSAKRLIELKPDIVRIYPTLIIKNTVLETLYNLKIYEPLSMNEAIEISAILLKMFTENNIKVIRVGLQVTENINLENDVVAGPFHSAFRQLVEQKGYLNKQIEIFEEHNIKDKKEVVIYLDRKKISYAVGNKGSNKKELMKRFNLENIKYIPVDEEIFNLVKEDEVIEIGVL